MNIIQIFGLDEIDETVVFSSREIYRYLYQPSKLGKKRQFAGQRPYNILTLNPETKNK